MIRSSLPATDPDVAFRFMKYIESTLEALVLQEYNDEKRNQTKGNCEYLFTLLPFMQLRFRSYVFDRCQSVGYVLSAYRFEHIR